MAYVYPHARDLDGDALIGDGECIQIVKMLVPGLIGHSTKVWKEGKAVKDLPSLATGTAIATFFNGRFPSERTGQHAALFIKHAGAGIWVVDQYRTSGGIRLRHIGIPREHARLPDGTWPNASRNALAFSVIER